jgi:hypothetical protein
MRKKTTVLLAALTLAGASAAQAQVFTPTYQSPRPSGDIGIYLADDALGGGLSVEGIYRLASARSDLGLRLGIAEAGNDETALLLGIDYRNPIELSGAAPFSLAFTVGGQAAVGEGEAFGAQVGLTAGSTIVTPEVTFTPYIHPRLGFISTEGDGDDDGLEVLADVGVDLSFSGLMLRFGANLGDGADFGIGLAFRR